MALKPYKTRVLIGDDKYMEYSIDTVFHDTMFYLSADIDFLDENPTTEMLVKYQGYRDMVENYINQLQQDILSHFDTQE